MFGVAFVVALNLAARLDRPTLYTLQPGESYYLIVARGPGQAIDAVPLQTADPRDLESNLYSHNLDRLQTVSLFAVIGLAAASAIGGYMLSGMLLRPVRDITDVASGISGSNLGQRINHQGPDDELKALADTFDSMISRIEESFVGQRQFIQDASHELRTPLAALRANIEVAEMDGEITPDEYRTLLDTLKTQTERLTRLSEDMLLLTTGDASELEPEPVDIDDLSREVVRQLKPVGAVREIEVTTAGPGGIEALATSDLLYRCVFNLVDNAIKYSGPGSKVVVKTSTSSGSAVVEVIDNGPGIAAEDLTHVFDRFYRVDKGRSRRQGGSGLGLSIVRELIHGMNGDVDVRSTLGEGTTFRLRLPLVRQAVPA
ncbi:hypothetical protein AYO38_01880 [bacterium SCGC AG-212-C10]|nr:hypothetical protein AYO38_01880 [bacterium SCGC AG-212-C10]